MYCIFVVLRMCDILHMRHTNIWLKPDFIFNFTKYAKEQVGLLDLIHGLTNSVSLAHFLYSHLWHDYVCDELFYDDPTK